MLITHRCRRAPVLYFTLAAILVVSALGSGRAAAQDCSNNGIFDAAPARAAATGDSVPEGLSASDWSSIRAAYQAGRHAAFAVDDGYQARNPGQRWRTSFDGRGGWIWSATGARAHSARWRLHPASRPMAGASPMHGAKR